MIDGVAQAAALTMIILGFAIQRPVEVRSGISFVPLPWLSLSGPAGGLLLSAEL